jgi:hypothetical protein
MTVDATFVAETDIVLTITAQDQDAAAINLSGATVTWYLKRKVSDAALITKTGSITGAASGIFTVTLTDTDTAGLDGTYLHEAKIVDASGNISRLRHSDISPGKLVFEPKISA